MAKKVSALSKLSGAPNDIQPSRDSCSIKEDDASIQTPAPTNVPAIKSMTKSFTFKKKNSSSALNKLTAKESDHEPFIEDERPAILPEEEAPPVTIVEEASSHKKNVHRSKRTSKPSAPFCNEVEAPIDYAQLEEDLENNELRKQRKERKDTQRRAILNRIGTITMMLLCMYLLFLIYGALKTDYVYNEDGKVVAQKMTYAQIEALEEFEKIRNEYLQAQRLYSTILEIDYRMAAGVEDPLLIAPEYEEVLDQVNELTIQCEALEVSPRYQQLHDLTTIWVKEYAAVYCQAMSAAISKNDAVKGNLALQYRSKMYNGFNQITLLTTTLGSEVDGANLEGISGWTPEKYINDKIDGMGGDT